MVRHYHRGPKWLKGEVLERIGPVLYKVLVDGATWRRHVDQMRRSDGLEYRNYDTERNGRAVVRAERGLGSTRDK